jgi:IPT/TIG domain
MPGRDNNNQTTGQRAVGATLHPWGMVAIVGYTGLFMIFVIYSLISFWPPTRSEEAKNRLWPSPTPTPTTTPTPTPAATPTPTPGATQRPAAGTGAGAAGQPASIPATTTAPPPSNTTSPSPSPKDCGTDKVREGFCLDDNGKPREDVGVLHYFGTCNCIYDEDRLLIIVLLAGALGALVHGLRSLSWYIGNRRAVKSWTAMYVMLPFLGAGLAAIAYFVIRGGFFSTTSTVKDTSPFAFAALATLAGMFTEPTVNKLRKIAISVLEPPEQGKDHVGPAPKVTSLSPVQGSTAGGDTVTITGTDFAAGRKVTFGNLDATTVSSTPTSITVTTPPHAAGKVDVAVINEDQQQHVIKDGFEYVEPVPGGGADAGADATTGAAATGAAATGEEQDIEAVDGCDVDIVDETPDEDLPMAEGGVA